MSVLDVADGSGNLAQRESAVNHRSHLSSFAELLQYQQVSVIRLHEYVTEFLTTDRKQWPEKQRVGQLPVRTTRHRVRAVGAERTLVVPNGPISVRRENR